MKHQTIITEYGEMRLTWDYFMQTHYSALEQAVSVYLATRLEYRPMKAIVAKRLADRMTF